MMPGLVVSTTMFFFLRCLGIGLVHTTMATNPKLNPFYIEATDEDWRYDDEDLEEEGLLEHKYENGSPVRRRPIEGSHQSSLFHHQKHGSQHAKLRYAVMVFVMFIIFMIFLSLTESSGGRQYPAPADLSNRTHHEHPRRVEVVIIGERNSGVHWLQYHLQTCYPNTTVSRTLTRDAYWFQEQPKQDENRLLLLIAIFRDPYDWIWQMNQNPIYMPAHMNGSEPLDIITFVNTPWTVPNTSQHSTSDGTSTCQLGFSPDQVVPCQISSDPENQATHAIYELDHRNGEPFTNIADMRAAKVQHIVEEIPHWWKSHFFASKAPQPILVQYESKLSKTLESMESITGWRRSCPGDNHATTPTADAAPANLPVEFVEWVNEHVTWDIEEKIGYQKRNPR